MSVQRILRCLSLAEGTSYLLLMCIAMPLKYVWGAPTAVRIAGSVHGIGTIALILAAAGVFLEGVLPRRTLALVMVLSLVPFGFLLADRMLRQAFERQLGASPGALDA